MAASGDRPPKRSRKDPSDPSGTKEKTTTPFEASTCKLVEMLATLPTLRESQRHHLLDVHTQFVKLRKTLQNLRTRKAEASVEDYQLKSTRFKFELNVSDQLYGEKKPEVDTLRENCKLAIALMQEQIRKQVVKVIDLEIDSIQTRLQNLFADTTILTSHTLAILDPSADERQAHDVYRIWFDDDEHAATLLKHSGFANSTELYEFLFKQETQANPPPPADPANGVPAPVAYFRPDNPRYSVTATSPAATTYFASIKALFRDSWDVYAQIESDNEKTLKVSKLIQILRAERASEQTAMDVDDIQEANNNTLKETVARAVAAEGKKIRTELQKDLKSKNGDRGDTKPAASLKKKTGQHPKKPQQPNKTNPKNQPQRGKTKGKQAAESDDDSSKGTRPRKNAKNSSTRRGKRSKRRGRR